ncbi:hypothetical protein C9994_00235 [Marivirga lumbricoides]|uniref:Uncharacterized protein n=1 Tax=Marivirga lumbricoides TaxID=1046115 RepID=A0A2T4DW29_9BACT|nr:hypothetical protein C9994_00235 [Marivirga lumbricoides]
MSGNDNPIHLSMSMKISPKHIKEEILKCYLTPIGKDQQYAKMIHAIARAQENDLSPVSYIKLEEILDRVVSNWDKSVEDFPFWLADTYGKSEVIAEFNRRLNSQLTEKIKSNVNTMKWWLNKPNARVGRI